MLLRNAHVMRNIFKVNGLLIQNWNSLSYQKSDKVGTKIIVRINISLFEMRFLFFSIARQILR